MEKSVDIFKATKEVFDLEDVDITSYSPLALAYIGDAIYEVVLRTAVMSRHNMSVDKMHKLTSKYVKAVTQAKVVDIIYDVLTQKEQTIYKRGRNAKSASMAKNASMSEYRSATGLEALVGYLYLCGDLDRAVEIIGIGVNGLQNKQK